MRFLARGHCRNTDFFFCWVISDGVWAFEFRRWAGSHHLWDIYRNALNSSAELQWSNFSLEDGVGEGGLGLYRPGSSGDMSSDRAGSMNGVAFAHGLLRKCFVMYSPSMVAPTKRT